jgi:hypothetical protein
LPDKSQDVSFPSHAYVPGKNTRHPEDWFDAIKAEVTADLAPKYLHETRAWRNGIAYFKAGYFWECHEVLEAIWLRTDNPSAERQMVQAVIQLANAWLKLRMARPRATHRLCAMARTHLDCCPRDEVILGLNPADVSTWVDACERELERILRKDSALK